MRIGATIAQAYGFLIRGLFGILGLIWLPVAILAVGVVALAPAFLTRAARIAELGLGAGVWRDEVEILMLLVVGLAIFAVPAISLSRRALALENDSFAAHLTFGAAEARLFLASLRLMLLLAAIVAIICITAYLLAGALGRLGVADIPFDENGLAVMAELWASPALSNAVLGVELIAFAAAFYAGLRFGFLLAPIAAAEEHASLARAWALSAGQSWRMLMITLGIAIPAAMAILTGSYFALGADFGRFYGFAADGPAQHYAEMAEIAAAHIPELIGVTAAGLFLFSALLFGASATAYGGDAPAAAAKAPLAAHPVMAAIAATTAATFIPEPAPKARPAIERSLLEQFGSHVHHDDARHAYEMAQQETPVAAMHEAPRDTYLYPAAEAPPPLEDIMDLETGDEIRSAYVPGDPPMLERHAAPLANGLHAEAAAAPLFRHRIIDAEPDFRRIR